MTNLNTTVSVLNLIINRGYQTILKDEILPSCNRLNILGVTLKMCNSKYILLYSQMQIYTNYLNKVSTYSGTVSCINIFKAMNLSD